MQRTVDVGLHIQRDAGTEGRNLNTGERVVGALEGWKAAVEALDQSHRLGVIGDVFRSGSNLPVSVLCVRIFGWQCMVTRPNYGCLRVSGNLGGRGEGILPATRDTVQEVDNHQLV